MRILTILLLFLLPLPTMGEELSLSEETAATTSGDAATQKPVSVAGATLESLVGEHLSYGIDFLWLKRLAKGSSRFFAGERPGTYVAYLEGKTRGMAAVVTQHRRQQYRSLMEMGPDGKLRTVVYERHIIKGKSGHKQDRAKRYSFDYEKRQILFSRGLNGEYGPAKVLPMPDEGEYYDILTACYNFRLGFFGPVERGAVFDIPSLTRKGKANIIIKVLTVEEQKRHGGYPNHGLLCRVELDKEIFKTGGGGVYVWFNDRGMPAGGVVENVLGMGDITGYLL